MPGIEDGDDTGVAVHPDALAGLDALGSEPGAGDGGQAMLAAPDRGVAHHSTDVGDRGPDLAEDRRPAAAVTRRPRRARRHPRSRSHPAAEASWTYTPAATPLPGALRHVMPMRSPRSADIPGAAVNDLRYQR